MDGIQRMVPGLAVYGVNLVAAPAHGVGNVAARQYSADREAELALAVGKRLEVRELPEIVGAILKPFRLISACDASITCLGHTAHRSHA
jgi:hypothetical protein